MHLEKRGGQNNSKNRAPQAQPGGYIQKLPAKKNYVLEKTGPRGGGGGGGKTWACRENGQREVNFGEMSRKIGKVPGENKTKGGKKSQKIADKTQRKKKKNKQQRGGGKISRWLCRNR